MDKHARAAIFGAGSRDPKTGRGWGCGAAHGVQYGAWYHHIEHRFTPRIINVLIFNRHINRL